MIVEAWDEFDNKHTYNDVIDCWIDGSWLTVLHAKGIKIESRVIKVHIALKPEDKSRLIHG